MRCRYLTILLGLLALAAGAAPAGAASLGGLAVDVANASEPVLCAEKDNVTLSFASPEVRAFRIEAAHPAYIGALARDSFEARVRAAGAEYLFRRLEHPLAIAHGIGARFACRFFHLRMLLRTIQFSTLEKRRTPPYMATRTALVYSVSP